jgi:hypothetical protein
VIWRYDEGVTLVVIENVDDSWLAIDAISKTQRGHLPGTAFQGLKPVPDSDRTETRATAGRAPRSGGARAHRGRERIYGVVRCVGRRERHRIPLQAGSSIRRLRWHRIELPSDTRYRTVRLAGEGTILGVLVEDD